ncbi:chromate transporter [Sinomicrobium weinanense]|uniref:Chromate transporter n=1 Tax=Sinomicrobium weinanense TaxID=2842200 RepID=A0A926JUL0_9FLAO|nr:chromate transporter [Sinomicrobium weinanense]MBC9797609.1 chromate transporter [Sinomicrobium weinanense]MBU3123431.1 chromate transporter [Sinomicrobium weinanense]
MACLVLAGGLAMVPLFIVEFEKHGWMTGERFMDVLSLAQMTPGAIAMNSATYVGNSVAGVPGGILATGALAAPSVIIMLVLSNFLMKARDHPVKKAVFKGLKPVTIALILFAGLQIAEKTFFGDNFTSIRWKVIVVGIVAGFIQYKVKKINPVFLIVFSGIAGILFL